MGIAKGDLVRFTGFAEEEVPDNGEHLVEGATYEVYKVSDEDGDTSYFLTVENPEFDASKRATKKNPEFLYVNVFEDEVEEVSEEEAEEAEEAEAEAEEEVEAEAEEEAEEEAPAPKKAAKKQAYKKGKEKEKEKETEDKPKRKPGRPKKAKAEEKAAEAPKKRGRPKKVQDEEEGDPDLKGLTILEREEEDEDVLAMVEDGDVLELAQELVSESTVTEYRLGGILYHVRVSKAYKELDPSYAEVGGFAAYIQEQLGLEYRKAMYLIDIYTKFSKAGIHGDVVGEIGWTKAKEIARVVNDENAESLIEAAKDSTVQDLKETIKESYSREGDDTRPVVKKMTFKFRLEEENAEVIQDYLLQAQEELGHDKLEQTFEYIVTEWAAEHLNVGKEKTKAPAKAATKAKATAKPRASKTTKAAA